MTTMRERPEPPSHPAPRSRRPAAGCAPDADDLARRLRKQEYDFTTIFEVATQINAHVLDDRHIDSYLKFLAHYLTTLARGQFGLGKAYLYLQKDLDAPRIVLARDHKEAPGPMVIDAGSDFAKRLIQTAAPIPLDGPAVGLDTPEADALRKLGATMAVPLVMASAPIGANLKGLLALGPKLLREPFSPSEIRLLGLLANMAAVAVHNAQLHRKSIIDHLTQVYSRGHFDLHLASELARAERYGRKELEPRRQVTLIMMDIDHFKSFNDAHGHPAGDKALRAVARAVQRAVRKSDILARYGGEEFVLIAVETGKEDGVLLAERLRREVSETTIMVQGTARHVTASFGVATFPDDGRTPQELVTRADAALYEAKEGGRNRICAARPAPANAAPHDTGRGETRP